MKYSSQLSIFLIILLIGGKSFAANDIHKTSREKVRLKGPVKEVRARHYEIDRNSGARVLLDSMAVQFNRAGYKIADTLWKKETMDNSLYEYDSLDLLQGVQIFQNGKVVKTLEMTNDREGNVRGTGRDATGRAVYRFTKSVTVHVDTTILEEHSMEKLSRRTIYVDGDKVQRETFGRDSTRTSLVLYEYKKGRMLREKGERRVIKEYALDPENMVYDTVQSTIFYNKSGFTEKSVETDGSGQHEESYTYEYDKKKNWVRKIVTQENHPVTLYERHIIYYE